MSDRGNDKEDGFHLSDMPFGIKVEVDPDVPTGVLLFIDSEGKEHVINNVLDVNIEIRKTK